MMKFILAVSISMMAVASAFMVTDQDALTTSMKQSVGNASGADWKHSEIKEPPKESASSVVTSTRNEMTGKALVRQSSCIIITRYCIYSGGRAIGAIISTTCRVVLFRTLPAICPRGYITRFTPCGGSIYCIII
jgi:hypothetical protein